MRCSFCHDTFPTQGGEPCPACGTRLHRDCWASARECPSLGCESRPLRRPAKAWSAVWLLGLLFAGFNHFRRPATANDRVEVPRVCLWERSCSRGPELRTPPKVTPWGVVRRGLRTVMHGWNESAEASYLQRQRGPEDLTIVEEVRERRRRRS